MIEKEVPGIRDEARFVAAMKRIREDLGISQGELAARLNAAGWEGFRQATVSRIEQGERTIRLAEAHAIAETLGLPFRRMMDEAAQAQTSVYARRISEIDRLSEDFAQQIAAHRKKLNTLERMLTNYQAEKQQLEAAMADGRDGGTDELATLGLLVRRHEPEQGVPREWLADEYEQQRRKYNEQTAEADQDGVDNEAR